MCQESCSHVGNVIDQKLEGAKLYSELLEKARTEVVEELVVQNSLVNFHAMRIHQPGLTERIMVTFELNGQLYVENVTWGVMEGVLHASKAQLIRFVAQRMSTVIMEAILTKGLDEMTRPDSL